MWKSGGSMHCSKIATLNGKEEIKRKSILDSWFDCYYVMHRFVICNIDLNCAVCARHFSFTVFFFRLVNNSRHSVVNNNKISLATRLNSACSEQKRQMKWSRSKCKSNGSISNMKWNNSNSNCKSIQRMSL